MFCQESTHLMVWCLIKHSDTLSVMCYVHKWTRELVEIVDCLKTRVKLLPAIRYSCAVVHHRMKILCVSLTCCSEPFLDDNVCLSVASGYRHLTFKLSFVLTYKGTA